MGRGVSWNRSALEVATDKQVGPAVFQQNVIFQQQAAGCRRPPAPGLERDASWDPPVCLRHSGLWARGVCAARGLVLACRQAAVGWCVTP